MTKRVGLGAVTALTAFLALPAVASAQGGAVDIVKGELDITWVMVAAVLVLFMQAGFLLLEIGFSRQKNVGAGVAKVLINLGVVTLAWWAVGFGISSLTGNKIFGTEGFFFHNGQEIAGVPVGGGDTALMLFGMLFCAVSLAIVWGTTLERIKFGAYVIYAAVFGAIIYPLVAHGVYGGGVLADVGGKPVMDFAGSSVVHLTGAVGALAALLLLGPRIGKYGADGTPRAIPGHSMPLVGLGVAILWVGWYGFNAGSTFGTDATTSWPRWRSTPSWPPRPAWSRRRCHLPEDEVGRRRHGRQRRDRRPGRDHGPVGVRRVLGRPDHRRGRRRDRRLRRLRDRQAARRSGRRALGARTRRHLGHARGRPVRLAATDPRRCRAGHLVRDLRRRLVRRDGRPARGPGGRRRGDVRARVHPLLRDLLRDQEDDRAPGLRGGGARRARHLLARDVRLPGVVHPPEEYPGGDSREPIAGAGSGGATRR